MDTSIPLKELFIDDATLQRRLHDGFLRYKGELMYCQYWPDNGRKFLMLSDPTDPHHQRNAVNIGWEPKHLDINPLPLGYMSMPMDVNAIYLMRMPLRKQKQLTSIEHMAYNQYPNFKHTHAMIREFTHTQQFKDAVDGKYMNPDNALKLIQKPGSKCVPIHRNFAFANAQDKKIKLLFKNIEIADYDIDTKQFHLMNTYSNCTSGQYLAQKLNIPVAL